MSSTFDPPHRPRGRPALAPRIVWPPTDGRQPATLALALGFGVSPCRVGPPSDRKPAVLHWAPAQAILEDPARPSITCTVDIDAVAAHLAATQGTAEHPDAVVVPPGTDPEVLGRLAELCSSYDVMLTEAGPHLLAGLDEHRD
jgi:hypothetical protein